MIKIVLIQNESRRFSINSAIVLCEYCLKNRMKASHVFLKSIFSAHCRLHGCSCHLCKLLVRQFVNSEKDLSLSVPTFYWWNGCMAFISILMFIPLITLRSTTRSVELATKVQDVFCSCKLVAVAIIIAGGCYK